MAPYNIIIILTGELTIMALFCRNLKICQWDDSKMNYSVEHKIINYLQRYVVISIYPSL